MDRNMHGKEVKGIRARGSFEVWVDDCEESMEAVGQKGTEGHSSPEDDSDDGDGGDGDGNDGDGDGDYGDDDDSP